MSRLVRVAVAGGAVLMLAACSSGGDSVAPTVQPVPSSSSATAAPSPSGSSVSPTASPTAEPTKAPTEYQSKDELPFEGNMDGDVAIIKGEVFVWNAATSSWDSRGTVDDNKKPTPEGEVTVGDPLTIPSKVKTFTTKANVQTVIAPDFARAPEFASKPWSVSVSPASAATLFDESPDPTSGAMALPSFVPTGKDAKFTLTVKSEKATYTYTVTVQR